MLPFGEVRLDVGDTITETDLGYTGQRAYGDFGLMDYKARFYSPKLGRFVQPDTIVPGMGNSQAWDRYQYVLNNPVRYNDPTGHSYCDLPNADPAACKDVKVGGYTVGTEITDDEDLGPDTIAEYTSGNEEFTPLIEILVEAARNNVNNAAIIALHPRSTRLQRAGAGVYLGFWAGALIADAVAGILATAGIFLLIPSAGVAISATAKKIQSVYTQHAEDWGHFSNWNKNAGQELFNTLAKHVNSSNVVEIVGKYRGDPAHFFYRSRNKLNCYNDSK